MRNNKAFTLIEVLAVIIIIAVVMLLAVPAYSNYIANSKKNVYADNMRSYVESAKGLVYSKYFGSLPEEGELLVIPINKLELEKSDKLESPYGPYVQEKSYIVVLPRPTTGNTASTVYNYYVMAIDKQNVAINNVLNEELTGKRVELGYNANDIASMVELASGTRSLTYNGRVYEFDSNRSGALLLSAE